MVNAQVTAEVNAEGLSVLVADDDWPILRALNARLTHAGFHVSTVSDGLNAVVSALDTQPDIAVLDINMPGLDGFSVAERIVENNPDCQILFLSANKSQEVRKKAGSVGLFVEKPFDSKDLTEKILEAAQSSNPNSGPASGG